MTLIFRSPDQPLAETARALSFAGWVIDSVDDHVVRAHRAGGPLVETLGCDSWLNDGRLVIERRDGRDVYDFQQCYPKAIALSMLAAVPGLMLGRGVVHHLAFYAVFLLSGLLIDRLSRRPRSRAIQEMLDQHGVGRE